MRMKRFSVCLFLLALGLLLSACGGQGQTAPTAETAETAGSSPAAVETEPEAPEATLPEPGDWSMQPLTFYREGLRIYGELYLPAGEGPFPAVAICHGLDANLSDTRGYAEIFAQYGVAAYVFDFIGGGTEIQSDGDILEMSVLTETADLETVLEGLRALEAVDADNVFLMGCSQGGFVATYTATRNPEAVRGVIAFYPAYGIQDDVKERTVNGYKIDEETCVVNGVTVGAIYMEDALSFNIFEVMKKYTAGTLLVHGTEDEVTPIDYSERAADTMENVELIRIEGAGHGFSEEDEDYAAECAVRFILGKIGRESED